MKVSTLSIVNNFTLSFLRKSCEAKQFCSLHLGQEPSFPTAHTKECLRITLLPQQNARHASNFYELYLKLPENIGSHVNLA